MLRREQLDELDVIIRDLGLAMDIRDQIEAGEERGLIDFADGTRISLPIPNTVKTRINRKITLLSIMLKEKIVKL